ncbi:reverse transcriptase domain-containing protein [Tanacetum coccineum]
MTRRSPSRLNDDHWDELKETDGEKDLEGHYTNAKPLGKALPRKEKEPGSFTLPCFINNMCFNKALADLGASISVMPYSTYTTLGLGDLIPTKLIVKLADRKVKPPKGVVENVLVSVDKFTFLVDFIILDILKDFKTPLILGRPFLSTPHAIINVFKAKITLSIGNDKIFFKSNKPTSNIIRRVYALGLLESRKHGLETRLMGDELRKNK